MKQQSVILKVLVPAKKLPYEKALQDIAQQQIKENTGKGISGHFHRIMYVRFIKMVKRVCVMIL